MSRRLPLFPLDLIVFPGLRAPLHIFEERYRALLRDVMGGDRRFGLVAPGPEGRPPERGSFGCVVRIVTHQPLPDGTANILVEGEQRLILRRLLDESTPYLQGLVEEFDDEEGATEVPADAESALRHLAERCRKAMAVLSDLPSEAAWSSDPGLLTFQVASTIPWDAAQARPLLAMRSAAERADLLLRLLPGVVPDLERRAAVHHRARGNGSGPRPPASPE